MGWCYGIREDVTGYGIVPWGHGIWDDAVGLAMVSGGGMEGRGAANALLFSFFFHQYFYTRDSHCMERNSIETNISI